MLIVALAITRQRICGIFVNCCQSQFLTINISKSYSTLHGQHSILVMNTIARSNHVIRGIRKRMTLIWLTREIHAIHVSMMKKREKTHEPIVSEAYHSIQIVLILSLNEKERKNLFRSLSLHVIIVINHHTYLQDSPRQSIGLTFTRLFRRREKTIKSISKSLLYVPLCMVGLRQN